MSREAAFEEARIKAAAFIGINRSKSSGRVRRNLLGKGVEPAIADEVVRYFTEIDYINDGRAAQAVASRYQGRKTRSRRAMLQTLIQNGIDTEAARRFVEGLEDDQTTALELCRHLAPVIEEGRLDQAMKELVRRGYPAGLARDTIRKYLALEKSQGA